MTKKLKSVLAALGVLAVPAYAASSFVLVAPIPAPDVSIDFAGDYSPQGSIPSLVSVTRASTKWCDDLSGKWHQVGNNVLCYTNKGALIEDSVQNQIRNSQFTGAVTGSPGTNPTNWVITLGSGMSQTINTIATDPATNIKYYSVTISGTLGGSGTQIIFKAQYESNTLTTSRYGITWANSTFLGQTSLTGVNAVQLGISGFLASGPTLEEDYQGPDVHSSLTGALQRFQFSHSLLNENTNRVVPYVQAVGTGGATVNMTLLVGQPQEEGTINTSTVVSATVNAPGSGYTVSQSGTMTWSGAGCGTNPILNVTTDNTGVISGVTGVANQGNCGTIPAAATTTWTPSASLGAGSNASFHLTPQEQGAFSAATSIIPTTNAVINRSADTATAAIAISGPGATLECEIAYLYPLSTPSSQFCGSLSDGTTNNEISIYRQGSNFGLFSFNTFIAAFASKGGVGQGTSISAATFGSGVVAKTIISCHPSTNSATNGVANTLITSPCALPTGMNTLEIGATGSGSQRAFGYIKTMRVWATTALSASAVLRASR